MKMEKIYAYLAENPEPIGERIVSVGTTLETQKPLVSVDRGILERFRLEVEEVAKLTGLKIRLVEFSHRSVLEEI